MSCSSKESSEDRRYGAVFSWLRSSSQSRTRERSEGRESRWRVLETAGCVAGMS